MTTSASAAGQQLGSSWRRALSRGEVEELLELSDLRGALAVATNWLLIGASFALVALWPNPASVIAALFLIGARQLGCAILMHEAAHRTLFRSRALNDWAGRWLAGYPVWSDPASYRAYHLQHHARTGTAEDPDLGLITPFPITRASLRRKILRDLTGRTGLKFARAAWRRIGPFAPDAARRRVFAGMLLSNAAILGALALAGRPELYLLWPAAWLTTYTLVTRIRSIAEHALTPDADDPLGNTRTTLARAWERLLVAPHRVNFHLEHHLLMTVPHYRLPRMHRLLRERGALERACLERGYLRVLRNAASKPDHSAAATDGPEPRIPPF